MIFISAYGRGLIDTMGLSASSPEEEPVDVSCDEALEKALRASKYYLGCSVSNGVYKVKVTLLKTNRQFVLAEIDGIICKYMGGNGIEDFTITYHVVKEDSKAVFAACKRAYRRGSFSDDALVFCHGIAHEESMTYLFLYANRFLDVSEIYDHIFEVIDLPNIEYLRRYISLTITSNPSTLIKVLLERNGEIPFIEPGDNGKNATYKGKRWLYEQYILPYIEESEGEGNRRSLGITNERGIFFSNKIVPTESTLFVDDGLCVRESPCSGVVSESGEGTHDGHGNTAGEQGCVGEDHVPGPQPCTANGDERHDIADRERGCHSADIMSVVPESHGGRPQSLPDEVPAHFAGFAVDGSICSLGGSGGAE